MNVVVPHQIARKSCLIGAAFLFGVALFPAQGRAHHGQRHEGVQRIVKFEAVPEGLRVVVTLELSRPETLNTMGDADRNHDGTLSRDEARFYAQQWARELSAQFRTEGGSLGFEAAHLGPTGTVQGVEGFLEAGAFIPASGSSTVRVSDQMDASRFSRTTLRFGEQPGASMTSVQVGSETIDGTSTVVVPPQSRFEDLELRFVAATSEDNPNEPYWMIGIGLAIIVAVGVARGKYMAREAL